MRLPSLTEILKRLRKPIRIHSVPRLFRQAGATFIAAGTSATGTTSGVTTDICSGTPSANTSWKTMSVSGYLTTYSTTESEMARIYFSVGAVTKFETRFQNTDLASLASVIIIPLGNGITFSGAEVIRWQFSMAGTATAQRLYGSFFGE